MVSFHVNKSLYTSSVASLPPKEDGPSLCDFPDAPGLTEGKVEQLTVNFGSNSVARLLFTYISGMPAGLTRIVTLFENCPNGVVAHFEPLDWVPIPYNKIAGFEPHSRYIYRSNVAGLPYAVGPNSGYAFTSSPASGVVKTLLIGPTAGYREISGAYTGFFEFGSTRSRFLSFCPFFFHPRCRTPLESDCKSAGARLRNCTG